MRVGLGEGGQGYHRVCLALWEGKGEAAGLPWATPLKGKGKEQMMNLRASCHSARYQRVPWGKEVPLQSAVGEKRLFPLGRGMSRRKEDPMRVATAHTLPIALVKALGVSHQP